MMNTYNRIIILSVAFLFSVTLFGQKNFNKGERYYDLNRFEEAMPYYLKEIDIGSSREFKDKAYSQLANCYRLLGQFELAEETYKKIFKRKKREPENVLNYAKALKSSAKYEEAAKEFERYMKLKPEDPMGEIFLQSCFLAQKWLDESLGNEVRNIYDINSEAPDFAPAFYDGGIVFCSSREGSKKKLISFNGSGDVVLHDFYYSNIDSIAARNGEAKPVESLNTFRHEGPATFTKDGNRVYFTRTVEGEREKDKSFVLSVLQVYTATRDTSGIWGEPESAFDFNSFEYSIGHPSLSFNDDTIYFISDKEGGLGGTDIYYSVRIGEADWGPPQNIGAPVNTFGYELFPFSHDDGTLYFSSNTHPGMGKLDVFSAIKKGRGWSNVTNLKPPINSIADDFGYIMNYEYNRGFFSSNRFNGLGSDDIYSFIVLEPDEVAFDGSQMKLRDQSLFNGITYKLTDKQTEEEVMPMLKNGEISYNMDETKDYKLVSRKDGFSDNVVELSFNREENKIELEVMPLKKEIVVNGTIRKEIATAGTDSYTPEDETPISNSKITLKKGNTQLEYTNSSKFGEFALDKPLAAGEKYTITASGGQEGKRKVKQPEKINLLSSQLETSKQNETPAEGVSLTGKLTEDGKSLNEAKIKVFSKGVLIQETKSSDKGEYQLNVPSGQDYQVMVYRGNEPIQTQTVSTIGANVDDILKQDIEVNTSDESISLKGTLTDNGEAIGEAKVKAYLDGVLVGETRSDAKGSYELQMMPGQDYKIMVLKGNTPIQTQSVNTTGASPKEILKQDIKISNADESVPLTGTLTDKGDVISGAAVKAYLDGVLVGETRSDDKGNYNLNVMPGQEYKVMVLKGNEPVQTQTISTIGSPVNVPVQQNIEVTSENDESVALKGVLTDNGSEMGGATVKAFVDGVLIGETRTDAKGNYELALMPDQDYQVMVLKGNESVQVQTVSTVGAGAAETVKQNIEVTGPDEAIQVQGVVMEEGKPVTGTTVKAFKDGVLVGETRSDAKGNYELGLLPDQEYQVMMLKGNQPIQTQTISTIGKTAKESVKQDLDVTGKNEAVKVKGVLTDEGKSMAEASVKVYKEGVLIGETRSDAKGNYELAVMPGHDYQVMVLKGNQPIQTQTISTIGKSSGAVIKEDIEVTSGDESNLVQGTLTEEGKPLKEALIKAYKDGVLVGETRSDAKGNYELAVMPGQDYQVMVLKGNNPVQVQTVNTIGKNPKEVIQQNFEVNSDSNNEAVQVNGKLTENGESIAGATVKTYLDGVLVGETQSDAKGNYELVAMPGQDYQVMVLKGNRPIQTQTITTIGSTSNEIVNKNIEVSQPDESVSIQGALTEKGKAIEEAVVQAYVDGVLVGETKSDAKGNYELSVMPGQDYQVMVLKGNEALQTQTVSTVGKAPREILEKDIDVAEADESVQVQGTLLEEGKAITDAIVKTYLDGVLIGETQSDAKGNYELVVMPGQEYEVMVLKGNKPIQTQTISTIGAVPKESIKENINVSADDESVKLNGALTEDGQVLGDATVRTYLDGVLVGETQSDAKGNYELVVMPGHDYQMMVLKGNEVIQTQGVTAVGKSAKETITENIEVTKGDESIKVKGKLTEKGESLEGTIVRAYIDGVLVNETKSDTKGNYELAVMPGQEYEMMVLKGNEPILTKEISTIGKTAEDEIKENIEVTQVKEAVAEVPLKGVITEGNNPINGATVKAYADGVLVAETKTNTKGEYEFQVPTNEQFEVVVSKDKEVIQSIAVSSPNTDQGKPIERNIQIEPTPQAELNQEVRYFGKITNNGEPSTGLEVRVYEDMILMGSSKIDAEGNYEISLPPGKDYEVFVADGNAPVKELKFTTHGRHGEELERNVELTEGAPLGDEVLYKGTITNEGQPVANAKVVAYDNDREEAQATTNEKGEYSLPLLPEKEYEVKVVKEGLPETMKLLSTREHFAGDIMEGKIDLTDAPTEINLSENKLTVKDHDEHDHLDYYIVDNESDEKIKLGNANSINPFDLQKEGDYTLEVRKGDYAFNKVDVDVKKNTADNSFEAEIKPRLKPIKLNGAITENPIEGRIVKLERNGVTIETTQTNSKGEYSFESDLEAGKTYKVKALNEEKAKEEIQAIHAKGQIKNEGEPLDDALVLLLNDGDIVDQAYTNHNGEYEFSLEPDKDYNVIVSKTGFNQSHTSISTNGVEKGTVVPTNMDMEKKRAYKVKGNLKSGDESIGDAVITISKQGKFIAKRIVKSNGDFEFELLPDSKYDVTLTKKGYIQKKMVINTSQETENPIDLDVELEEINEETSKVARTINIYYEYGSADLSLESLPALYDLIDFLKENKEMKIEISSHTDSRGSKEFNYKLSKSRAENVVLFLYFDGEISKSRMEANGYGETRLINKCADGITCTEEEHKKNRRTEFKILSY